MDDSKGQREKVGTGLGRYQEATFAICLFGYPFALLMWAAQWGLARVGHGWLAGVDQVAGNVIRLGAFAVLNVMSNLIQFVVVVEVVVLVLWFLARPWRSCGEGETFRRNVYWGAVVHAKAVIFWVGAPAFAVMTTSAFAIIALWFFSWCFFRALLNGKLLSSSLDRKALDTGTRIERLAASPTVSRMYLGVFAYLLLIAWNPEVREPITPLIVVVGIGAIIRFGTLWITRHMSEEGPARLNASVPFVYTVAWVLVAAAVPGGYAAYDYTSRQVPSARVFAAVRSGIHLPRGSVDEGITLYLVSDNQFRDLDGKRSSAHVKVIESVIHSSMRPAVLELLSESSFARFLDIGASLPTGDATTVVAHLGDFADLSCDAEMDRIRVLTEHALTRSAIFAGFAIGNHDGFFLGNFEWFPGWHSVCDGEPMDRADALERLGALLAGVAPDAMLSEGEPFLAAVTPIGTLATRPAPREVVAVVLDTSDLEASLSGLAGHEGDLSGDQVDWVLDHVPREALVVLLQHHPYEALSSSGQEQLQRLVVRLDGRVLAVVAAHTHEPYVLDLDHAFRGARALPELVAGSTTDPPQSSAVINLRPGRRPNTVALYFETIPLVHRTEGEIPREGQLTVEACKAVHETLGAREECDEVLGHRADFDYTESPAAIQDEEEAQARALYRCLGVETDAAASAFSASARRQLARRPTEALCIAWAASWMEQCPELSLDQAFAASLGADGPARPVRYYKRRAFE